MDRQTRKLIAQALLSAASVLSASTDKRLNFALQRLKPEHHKKLLWIVFNATGLELIVSDTRDGFSTGSQKYQVPGPDGQGYKALLEALKQELSKSSVVDGYIPWLSMQLNKGISESEYQELKARFRAVSVWASETRTDIGKLSAKEALELSKGYESKAAQRAAKKTTLDAENPVVMTFGDGWFIRQLKTEEALKTEGERQGICVGGKSYCIAVKTGSSNIYSLRDPGDNPKVTIEVKGGVATQMFGRENSEPEEAWKKYLIEFVEKKLNNDIKSLLLAGKPARDIDLRGANLTGEKLRGANLIDANLTGANLTEANLYKANLTGANLTGAKLTDANLYNANLEGANLRGANLRYAYLTEANLEGADLTDAILYNAKLKGADLTDAILYYANLTGANLEGADLRGANLEGIKYDSGTIWPKGFTPPPSA